MLLNLAIITVVAYFIGAIPVGVIVAKMHHVDIHAHGSGKMGTTNVLRTVGRRAAAVVLIGDFLKGSIAVVAAKLIFGILPATETTVEILGIRMQMVTLAAALAAAGAVAGHVWSIYLRVLQGKWRGGRGVATAQGAILVVNPLVLLIGVAVGVPVILISRYVSLGSILGAVAAGLGIIVLVLIGQMDPLALLFISLCIFIVATHHDNIERLLKGTERKLGDRAKV